MPIYVYPQGPSAPISRLKRVDEQASANEATKLDVQQEVAIIGETIPLIFGKRVTYTNSDGNEVTHGGCWTTPRLIALGLTNGKFSLMYVLTQGRLVNLPIADVKYGSTKLEEIDGNSLCLAYQQIPDCVDIEYTPGGSLGWESQIISSGPSLALDQSEGKLATWTSTTSKCIAIAFNFSGLITVSGSGSYVTDLKYSAYNSSGQLVTVSSIQSISLGTGPSGHAWPNSLSEPLAYVQDSYSGSVDFGLYTNGQIQPSQDAGYPYGKIYDQSATAGRSVSWTAYSYRTWNYRVVNDDTDEIVKTGSIKLGGFSIAQTLAIQGLTPAKYRVEFYGTSALRTHAPAVYTASMIKTVSTYRIEVGNGPASSAGAAMMNHQDDIVAAYNNKLVENIQGNESVNVSAAEVFERVYDELEFPDAPGSGEVVNAGYRNLTLVGITGTTSALRPVTGPDYFLQLHCFCREGIYVKQQLQSMQLGPSNVYSDLVLHLLEQGGMLKTEQIDYQALLYAARFCEQYKLHFNGVLSTTNSGAEWLTRTAPYFLCAPRQVDGKYGLTPVVPIDAQYKISEAAVTPVMTLTTDDIVQNSYNRQYINVRDRRLFAW